MGQQQAKDGHNRDEIGYKAAMLRQELKEVRRNLAVACLGIDMALIERARFKFNYKICQTKAIERKYEKCFGKQI